ncbi:MAG: putative sugar O-methyltransferase, partial [Thalassobaculaceae bacterium]|nr:putative sugar O-methyltransferase [Thalassobaculaceae bacterium]
HAKYANLTPPSDARLYALLELHEALLGEAAANHHLGWRPAGGESQKYRFELDRERLRHFADYAYGGIGFEVVNDFLETLPSAEDLAPRIVKEPQLIHNAGRQTLSWINGELRIAREHFQQYEQEWAALLHEPAEMGGIYANLTSTKPPIRTSNQATRVSWRAPMLAKSLGRAPSSILEIGGGHGKFTRDCALFMPETRLFLTDLPFNLIIQSRYLGEYFGDAVNLCLLADQDVDPNARINLVAPWRLDRIPGPIDVVANFLSFQHMDAANLDWYGDAIEALEAGHIFHLNRLTKRDPHDFAADDYPFRTRFRPDMRTVSPLGQLVKADGTVTDIKSVMELLTRA